MEDWVTWRRVPNLPADRLDDRAWALYRRGSKLASFIEPPRHGGPVDRAARGNEPGRRLTDPYERSDGTVDVDCWCGHDMVRVPAVWPSQGRTGSCGWALCDREHPLERVRGRFTPHIPMAEPEPGLDPSGLPPLEPALPGRYHTERQKVGAVAWVLSGFADHEVAAAIEVHPNSVARWRTTPQLRSQAERLIVEMFRTLCDRV